MFNEGDKVRIRSNGAGGTVVYAEDGYVSVELTTGVEVDFENPDLLMSEDEYQVQQEASRPVPTSPSGDISALFSGPYVPQKGDRARAVTVIDEIQKIYPGLLDAMRVRDENFDKLDGFDKVKFISEMSGTPMVLFMNGVEMGMLREIIRKTLLNNIISGTDLTMDILLGTALRTIKEYEDK